MPLSPRQANKMSEILTEPGEEVRTAKTKLSGAAKALAIDTKDPNGPVSLVLPPCASVC